MSYTLELQRKKTIKH